MSDITIELAGRRFEILNVERWMLEHVGQGRRAGIGGMIYRGNRPGWRLEVAVGSFALSLDYAGKAKRKAA